MIETLQEKLNRVGQELDCKIIDNERYKFALRLACKEIVRKRDSRYFLLKDNPNKKEIQKIMKEFLLEARENL